MNRAVAVSSGGSPAPVTLFLRANDTACASPALLFVLPRFVRAFLFSLVLLASTAARDFRPPSLAHLPKLVLWAWEHPEDLRGVDPHRYAIAYLDRTIFLGHDVTVRPRLQPIQFAPGARVMAVVRIEAPEGPIEPSHVAKTADAIVASARPFVSAIQIDFDATTSQRAFYRALLENIRPRLRPGLPLSITALASWCSSDDWIARLPVDEAVPMFFRMETGVRRIRAGWKYPVREPLCSTSAGLSTDEAWPQLAAGLRLYVFHPGSWNPVALSNLDQLVNP